MVAGLVVAFAFMILTFSVGVTLTLKATLDGSSSSSDNKMEALLAKPKPRGGGGRLAKDRRKEQSEEALRRLKEKGIPSYGYVWTKPLEFSSLN